METTVRVVPEIEGEVEFYGFPEYVESGIGAYEFWGQRDYHSVMTVRCEIVYWDEKSYSAAENEIIKKYLNDYYGEIATELEESYS